MKSEKTVWRFWVVALALLAGLWAFMGLSWASNHGSLPIGMILFLAGSYCLIALICLLGARFQIYELRADEERWERIDTRIRRWTQATFGAVLMADAFVGGRRHLLHRGDADSLLFNVFVFTVLLCFGIFNVQAAFRTKRKRMNTP